MTEKNFFLRVNALSKTFPPSFLSRKKVEVFKELNFELKSGDCCLLTGNNGSGKTTLMRCIAGLLTPEKGSMDWKQGIKKNDIFYISGGERGFYWRLSVYENLRFFLSLYGQKNIKKKEIEEELENFNLKGLSSRSFATLSSGQKTRIQFLLPFLLPHRLWLLDEPFQNVDEEARGEMMRLIQKFLSKRKEFAVCIATHLKYEAGNFFSCHWSLKDGQCGKISI